MEFFARASAVARLIVPLILVLPYSAAAQGRAADDQLRVYIDCSYFCDMDFIRTEVAWVDHMRDRADADVHVLVTRQATGGGGFEYALEFIGLRRFTGRADTLRHVTSADATSDIVRRGLTHTIKLGLVPFVAATPLADRLVVSMPVQADAAPAEPPRDPWKFWTFTLGLNGNVDGETQANSSFLSGSTSANRTTEMWKVNLRLNMSYSEQVFKYTVEDEDVTTRSIRRSYGVNTLLVRSVTPHLSIGARATASSSTVGNTSLTFNITPAVEYNYFPYAESTRRSLIVQYSAGMRYADYRELTIFDQLEETRPIHNVSVGYATRQPWGAVNVGVNASQFLHDATKYNVGVGGGMSLRIVRGLSFELNGGYTRVRDQLSLAKRNLTEEEILLRQLQFATAYNYYAFFGVSYRFGSIFNNIVNARFGPSPSSGMMIMM